MRVQRAPRATEQPQPAPADHRPRLRAVESPPAAEVPTQAGRDAASPFVAEVDLDLTDVVRRSPGADHVVAEVAAVLLGALRDLGVVHDHTALQVLSPDGTGWSGRRIEQATRQSVRGLAVSLGEVGPTRPVPEPVTLVRLDGSAARATGAAPVGGTWTATLSAAVDTVVPLRQETGSVTLATRTVARLSLSAPAEAAPVAVAALDAVRSAV